MLYESTPIKRKVTMNLHADVNLVYHPISIVKSIFHQIKNPNNHDGVNNENQILIRVFLYPVPRGTHYFHK